MIQERSWSAPLVALASMPSPPIDLSMCTYNPFRSHAILFAILAAWPLRRIGTTLTLAVIYGEGRTTPHR